MPKLDGTHIHERLRQRLEQLKNGEEVARRELETLLTTQQIEAWDAAWNEQKRLRKAKRARTKEEEAALGWKSKREITIEAIETAFNQADDGLVGEFERLTNSAKVRQLRIYFDGYTKALEENGDEATAAAQANNDLTRAALNRIDGKDVLSRMSKRDREILALEQGIKQQFIDTMSEEERKDYEESQEILNAMEEALMKRRKAKNG
jgi:hypothetical protein